MDDTYILSRFATQ